MGEFSRNFWADLDAELALAEAELDREKSWLEDSVEDSLTELDAYLHTLSPEDHTIALEGIQAYKDEVRQSI